LNLYEDHLDHYGTMEKYVRAKKNIYLNQRPLDLLLCIDAVRPAKEESVSRTVAVTSDVLPFRSFSEVEGARLRGEHNLLNCAFVYTVAKTFGISGEEFISSLKTFSPLRHRLELIGEKDGVEYFDDSISTTVESAISAMESVANASTILLGGMDRGIEYDKLVSYLRSKPIKNVICMYDSGRRIYDMLSEEPPEGSNLLYRDDLESAVSAAKEVTGKGEACILSPASASYGYFKNFEERGDVFKSLALE
jgi:UDP-N-acetylmuramoylalanine--D-glutamate ligase